MSNLITVDRVCSEIKEVSEEKYHRGKSWEYCYVFFRNYKKLRSDKELLDLGALHLGFFLASWGMLRGSSFLLQMNYRYYVPVIRVLIKEKYNDLWNVDWFNKEKQEEYINLLFELNKELRHVMERENNIKNKKGENKKPSDTLITKIIMATLGCTPAYDIYFKEGLKLKDKQGNSFTKKSFSRLLNLCRKDKSLSKIYEKHIPTLEVSIKYPPMKLLDLYLWRLGGGK